MSVQIQKVDIIETIPFEGYAGNVDCQHAYEFLSTSRNSCLIDVRSQAEWQFVGVPVMQDSPVIFCQWQIYPSMQMNPDFVREVEEEIESLKAGYDKETMVLFTLCRSGQRSIAAAQALTQQGFSAVYNIIDGFEGDVDQAGHRSCQAGWKAAQLPWRQ